MCFLTYWIVLIIISCLFLYYYISFNGNASLSLGIYLYKGYAFWALKKILFYLIILVLYIFLDIYFAEVIYCISPEMEEIRETISFFQNEVLAIQESMQSLGLNKNDTMLSQAELSQKAEYSEALKDSKDALRENIRKLSLISEQSQVVETSGKRLNSETSDRVINTDNKRS